MKILLTTLIIVLGAINAYANDAGPDIQVTKEAFSKTLASGLKRWALKNVVVEYEKSVNNISKGKWTANCSASGPVSLAGEYPTVSWKSTSLDCGSHQPSELNKLYFVTRNLFYGAVHIPAYPAEPNQFRLDFESINSGALINWDKQQSLNAHMKDRVVLMDFLGQERGDFGWRDQKNHFVQLNIKQGDDGKSEKMIVNYNLDTPGQKEAVVIRVTADLERMN